MRFERYVFAVICSHGESIHAKIRPQTNRNGREMTVFQSGVFYLESSIEKAVFNVPLQAGLVKKLAT